MVISLATTCIATLAHCIAPPTLLHNMRPSGSATEHAPIHVVSEHSGASQVATEHNVTDQSTSDVNDTESDDGPIRHVPSARPSFLMIHHRMSVVSVAGRHVSIAWKDAINQNASKGSATIA